MLIWTEGQQYSFSDLHKILTGGLEKSSRSRHTPIGVVSLEKIILVHFFRYHYTKIKK